MNLYGILYVDVADKTNLSRKSTINLQTTDFNWTL